MFIVLSVLEVAQRVPPTCMIKTSRTLKSGLTEIKVQPLPMLTWPYSHILHTTADSTSVYCRCSIGQCAHVEEPKCVANLPVSQGWHVVAPGRIGFESQGMQSSRVKRVKRVKGFKY